MGQPLIKNLWPAARDDAHKDVLARLDPGTEMELTADEMVRNFPTPRTDFDGSVIINRTARQTGSRYGPEAVNIPLLTVLVDSLGQEESDETRGFLAENLEALGIGREVPCAEKLQFAPGPDSPGAGEEIMSVPSDHPSRHLSQHCSG